MPTSAEAGTVSPTYRHRAITRSLLSGGIGIGGRRIATLRFEDGGKAGSQADSGKQDGDGNGDEGKADDDDDGETPEDTSGLKSALQKARDERKHAKADAKQMRERLDELEQKQRDADDAKQKADDEAAEKRGEFEQLAAKREQERDAAKAEASTLKAENDQLRAAITEQVEAGWKELPKEVQQLYPGADDDPLARLSFLAKSKDLVEKLTGTTAQRGNGVDPKASGAGTKHKEEATKAQASLYRRF